MQTASLRRRLTLTCLGVLLLAVAGFDAFLYLSFESRLTGDLDRQLVDRAGLAKLLDGELTAQQLADRLAGGGVMATVRHDGTVHVGRPTAPPRPVRRAPRAGAEPGGALIGPSAPGAKAAPAPPAGTVTHVVRRGSRLTLTETLDDGTLVLRADRGEIDAELRRLLALEAIGSAIVLLGAALALTLLIRRAVRPVDEMTRAAVQIADGRTGRRLHPTRTDTELGRMARAFDTMLDSLQEAIGQAQRSEGHMREFVSDISHELRTPVAGMVATAEVLLREGAATDPAHEAMLVLMIRQSQRAGRLIDDLLTLSRLEHGDPLRADRVDLSQLVDDEVDRARILTPLAEVTATGPDRLPVLGDRDRLSQVLANLLDNARHATPDGGVIDVTWRRDGDRVVLEVSDTGPGVPEGERERIFERLVRLDPSRARSRERFGGGLGLPIARLIAVAHGGTLTCEAPAPGARGARFVLELPAPATVAADGARPGSGASEGRRVAQAPSTG